MLKKLLEAIEAEDYKAVSECFSDDISAEYIDYVPAVLGGESVVLCGKTRIEMFFRNEFYNHTFMISQVRILDDFNANYFALYTDRYGFDRLTIEKLDPDGKILRAVSRPE